MSTILRRYFVMSAFDGAVTLFGVILASFLANIIDPLIVIKLGLATTVAVGVSGFAGAFFTESAERKLELKQIEASLHRTLERTDLHRAYLFASVITAVVDGLSPFLASIFILLPFALGGFGLSVEFMYYSSFFLALVCVFFLGMFLGKVSQENLIKTGIKLVLAGLACMAIISLIDKIL